MDKKLVSYIPIGLKEQTFNIDLICSMRDNGVDIAELGLPFSDPVADGGVIQEANLISLKQGYKIKSSFDLASRLTIKNIDFVFMGYFNTFYKQGMDKFIEHYSKGCIIPDLPFEEAQAFFPLFDKYNKSVVQLIAPTTPKKRIKKLVANSSLFIYLVAYLGVTGDTQGKSEDLSNIISSIREYSDTPIYLGFGVNPQNAQAKCSNVDGVIVGSYFVEILLDDSLSDIEKINKISMSCASIKEQINS